MASAQWPLNAADNVVSSPDQQYVWIPIDPLDIVELPPLVFPRPQVDKALRDDGDQG